MNYLRFLAVLLFALLLVGAAPQKKEKKMKVKEALPKLNEMLKEASVDLKHPNPQKSWEIFKEFARLPVDCASNGLLFECGVYDFTGKRMFYFEFVRQFTVEKRGDFDHMEQLNIEFQFVPTSEIQDLKTHKWSFDFNSPDEFFRFVESLKEFRSLIDGGLKAAEVRVYQERI